MQSLCQAAGFLSVEQLRRPKASEFEKGPACWTSSLAEGSDGLRQAISSKSLKFRAGRAGARRVASVRKQGRGSRGGALMCRAMAEADQNDSDVVYLLDYGAGNVRSVRNAINLLGYKIRDVSTPEDILKANKLIFPGVGAFAAAMSVINDKGMGEAIKEYCRQDRPFLGICLGMQLLFEGSTEFGAVEGLGIIPGTVDKFDASHGLRVPHIGWNGLSLQQEGSLLEGVNGRHVYFVHSYRAMPSEANKEWGLATSQYGGPFLAAVKKGNVQAVQFHPEKSGVVGLDILRRFLGPSRSEATQELLEAAERAAGLKPASALAKRV